MTPRAGDVPPEDTAALGPPGDPVTVARTICLRLLDRRARTRSELSRALRERGVPDGAATVVLDRLREVGLIDDAALAGAMAAAQHRERGLAARAVAAKLRRRGVPEPDIEAAIDPIDRDSEYAAARYLVTRRLPSVAGLPAAAQLRRLVAMLGRRGYPAGVAYEVVRDMLRAESPGSDGPEMPAEVPDTDISAWST